MNAKRNQKQARPETDSREKKEREFALEQPIQTALYAKLSRLGREVN
jgi:hypothetical protein